MALRLYECNTPTKPNTDFYNTVNFGLPKGIEGRNGNTIKGIVIHCIPNALNDFDTHATRDWRLGDKATPRVASVHYAVGQSGAIRQYVCDDNIAWGFSPLLSDLCQTPTCSLDWSLVTANPNKDVDEYLLHIALESPVKTNAANRLIKNDSCGCVGATVLNENSYGRLVQLLAWLAETYGIAIDADHIQFAQAIRKCPTDDCAIVNPDCECADLAQVFCDINAYCERCKNPRDLSFTDGNAITIYGENASECKTKQSISALLQSRLKFNAGQLGIVDDAGVWHPITAI